MPLPRSAQLIAAFPRMRPSRRKIEAAIAGAILLVSAPLWVLIAAGILLSDPGPIFYCAQRCGAGGAVFRMYKFRTMRAGSDRSSRITGANDPRVFTFGAFLRRWRLDELPQLINIVRGEMAFVGPRPEDPWIVENAYSAEDRRTLDVLPGLTSPGSLYYVRQAEPALSSKDTEAAYISGPLRTKLDIDRAYIPEATARSDIRMIVETARAIFRVADRSRV